MIKDEDFINKIWFQKCGDSLLVLEKSNQKQNKSFLWKCKFQKYPLEIYCRKDRVIDGNILNPLIEEKEFINKLWPQNCGDIIKVIEKTEQKRGNDYLWECEFIKYPYKVFTLKSFVMRGQINNPQIEQVEFIDKIWPQNCGDSLKIIGKDDSKIGYWNCEFIKYPFKVSRLKTQIIKGIVTNPLISENEFIGTSFLQHCGDNLKIIEKTNKFDKGEVLYKCEFQKYPYIVLATKGEIKKGHIANKNLPYSTKNNLKDFILNNFIEKPTIKEISIKLNISCSHLNHLINKYELRSFINLNDSQPERDIREFLYLLTNNYYKNKILENWQEIDIYIPESKLGIEFNGNFWHSNIPKYGISDKNYHQKKKEFSSNLNIDIFNIFEYEWQYNEKIIKSLIKSKLGIFDQKIGARKCIVKELENNIYQDFCNENHLQGKCGAKVKLGLFFGEELIQVMSFGVPRFTNKYEWEIIRECSKLNYCIIGGKEKLWSYFVEKYNPNSVISYCDFSKFNGNSYLKLGFKKERLTTPGFVWYDKNKNETYWRNPYKNKEMKEKGYLKIYDCGQLVFTWFHKN